MLTPWYRWFSRRRSTGRRRAARGRRPSFRYRCRFDLLEDRLTPSGVFFGGVNVATGDVTGDGITDLVTGAGPGGGPHVKVFDGATGNLAGSFFAYEPGFTGGVSVAVGNINGSGPADIVTGPGPGGTPLVKVFDASGHLLLSFNAYNAGFNGGVNVAVGDVEGTGRADIITAPASAGLSNIRVFNGQTGALVRSFFAFDMGFYGGASVAAADLNGDGHADIIVGSGPGAAPDVKVYNGNTVASVLAHFKAYDPNFQGGVRVAAGDVFGTGTNDIITGPATGGGPNVRVFDPTGTNLLSSFLAYNPGFQGGVNVATLGTNIVTGAGKTGGPHVQLVPTSSLQAIDGFFAYDPAGTPGVPFGQAVTRLKTPTLTLDPAFDTGAIGDFLTSLSPVTLDGTTSPNVQVTLQPTGSTTTADASGNFSFTNVPLTTGANTFTVTAVDAFGNQASFSQTVTLTSTPSVGTPINNVSVAHGASPTTINLSSNFTSPDVVGTQLRLNTNFGPVDMQLLDQQAPLTVNNFLNYVNSGRYNNDIFHRLASGFVLQGGGFTFNASPTPTLTAVQTDPPVHNEFGASNVAGTVAMAKLGSDPNSATSQFFFNLANNSSNLDNQNGGFTVFANVINNTFSNVTQAANTPIKDESAFNSALNTIPLVNYNGTNFPTDTTLANYLAINNISFLRHSDQLTFSVTNNSNPSLVTPTVVGNNLTLTYAAGQTGSSTITVRATNKEGQFIETTFMVTVS